MDEKNVVVLSEEFPVPVRSIWKLIEYASESPRYENGAPVRGYEGIIRARNTVAAWMRLVDYELGYPMCGENSKAGELHPDETQLGVCPFCHLHDDALAVGEEVWGHCHTHQVRWKVPDTSEIGFFVADGADFWEAEKNPVRDYAVVSPTMLLNERGGGAVSWVKAVVRKLFPKARQLSTHPRQSGA